MNNVTFEKLSQIIFSELKPKLESNQGVSNFAKERAKFEGWFKVELCDSLAKYFQDVAPEKGRVDITFENWGIELKTINTNYRYPNVKKKTRPITMNTQGIINDIEKLQKMDFTHKAVLFIAFPTTHEKREWQIQLEGISKEVKDIKHSSFRFKDDIPGLIYFGLI